MPRKRCPLARLALTFRGLLSKQVTGNCCVTHGGTKLGLLRTVRLLFVSLTEYPTKTATVLSNYMQLYACVTCTPGQQHMYSTYGSGVRTTNVKSCWACLARKNVVFSTRTMKGIFTGECLLITATYSATTSNNSKLAIRSDVWDFAVGDCTILRTW